MLLIQLEVHYRIFLIIDNVNVGNHEIVRRFMRGIYQIKPTCSRYESIWDVNIVFNYFRSLQDNSALSFKLLTLKTATLLALVSSQRIDSLFCLRLSNMQVQVDKIVFALEKVKQPRPSCKSMFITLCALKK